MKTKIRLFSLLTALTLLTGCFGSSSSEKKPMEVPVVKASGAPVSAQIIDGDDITVLNDEDYNYDSGHVYHSVVTSDPKEDGESYDVIYSTSTYLTSPMIIEKCRSRSYTTRNNRIFYVNEETSQVLSTAHNGKDRFVEINGLSPDAQVYSWKHRQLLILDQGKISIYNTQPQSLIQDENLAKETRRIDKVRPYGASWLFYAAYDETKKAWDLCFFDQVYGTIETLAQADSPEFALAFREKTTRHYALYYLKKAKDAPAGADERLTEYEVMVAMPDGTTGSTGVTGAIGGKLISCDENKTDPCYLFYSVYVEDKANPGSYLLHPCCYDKTSGKVFSIDRPEFEGCDIELIDVYYNFMYMNIYKDGKYVCTMWDSLKATDNQILTSDLLKDAKLSELYEKEEEEKRQAEEEKRRQEELKNEPYGPGTSSLYLTSGKQSACFRLIRMDGTQELQVLLEPNEKKTVSFPSGRYTLKIARGDTWISDDEAFGPKGSYSSTNVFTFEPGETYEISTSTTGNVHGDSQSGFTG